MNTLFSSLTKKITRQIAWQACLAMLLMVGMFGGALAAPAPVFAAGPPWTISGNAGVGGAMLYDGVTLLATSNPDGSYSFTVPDTWSGTVTPSLTDYLFYPTSIFYASVTSDLSGQDYLAVPLSYSISGNTGVGGVVLTYFDVVTKTVTSDGGGAYNFRVPAGWTGTVTPSKPGYIFVPSSITYSTPLASNQTNQNYVAFPVTETATPTITSTATLTATITPTPTETLTPTVTSTVTPTGTITVTSTPTPTVTETLTPTLTQTVTPTETITSTVTVTTTVTVTPTVTQTPTTHTISGNTEVGGVTLSWDDGGPQNTTSDGSGNYSFAVPDGWSGSVTPSLTDYLFSPTSILYFSVTTNQINQDYIAVPITVAISGTTNIGGVLLTYNDGGVKTVTTNPDGTYTFRVPYNWSGPVTPSLAGYMFTPSNRTYPSLTSNQTGQDYTATPATSTATVTVTQTSTPTETLTPTVTSTVTQTLTMTETATTTQTLTPTLTATITPTLTETATVTQTLTATETATITETPTVTSTTTETATTTQTLTPTLTGTVTLTETITLTATVTATQTQTPTLTLTATITPTRTVTRTLTKTPTRTVTPTITRTRTVTVTRTPTRTPTRTLTKTPTRTPTRTLTKAPTRTITPTPVFRKLSPVNGAIDYGPANVILSWTAAWTFKVEKYRYCYDTTPNNGCDGAAGWTESFVPNTPKLQLAYNTTYYWHVQAITCGACVPKKVVDTDNGKWWSFTTKSGETFTKSTPGNGETDVDPSTTSTAVLSWTAYTPAFEKYRYCFDTSPNNGCDESAGWTETFPTQRSVAIKNKKLAYNTTYYWHVQAITCGACVPKKVVDTNNGKWWSFTTMAASTFTKSTPGNGETDVDPSTTSTAVFSWTAYAPAFEKYRYCFDTSPNNGCDDSAGWTETFPTQRSVALKNKKLAYNTTYYWHVQAITCGACVPKRVFDTNNGNWWSFTTMAAPEFEKITPANGATNINPLKAVLSWTEYIPSSGFDRYRYCYDTSNNNSCDGAAGWTTINNPDHTITSVTLKSLTYDTTYYWHVQAIICDTCSPKTVADTNNGNWWSFKTSFWPTLTPTPTRTLTPTVTPVPVTKTFKSSAAQDGWVLESSENSGVGGSTNNVATSFVLGDDASNRQYKSILSFDTSALPDTATVRSALLKIKQSATAGSSPFSVLGGLWTDIYKGSFGATTLEVTDFSSAASLTRAGIFSTTPVNGWYTDTLSTGGLNRINKVGITQIRLYFSKDDNNNHLADYIKFLSGNSATDKPTLTITYWP